MGADSKDPIRKVCVIGAGTMGAGIAAQVANAGVPVLLLDILPKDGGNRNAVAEGAVARSDRIGPEDALVDEGLHLAGVRVPVEEVARRASKRVVVAGVERTSDDAQAYVFEMLFGADRGHVRTLRGGVDGPAGAVLRCEDARTDRRMGQRNGPAGGPPVPQSELGTSSARIRSARTPLTTEPLTFPNRSA